MHQMAHARCRIISFFASFLCVAVWAVAAPSFASINAKSPKYAALMMDADSGEVYFSRNADAARHPASLTKMMTLYLTFERLAAGKIKLTDKMPVSAHAAGMPQTNIGLRKGQTIPVEAAIRNLVVRSANDAAVVIGEYIGGTEWDFALMMTAKARELGMKNTVFRNANGLPDARQITTARDMAKLGLALRRDFPQYFPYFKITTSSWNGVNYPSHNRVMLRYHGVDGIKTGYINASGFNLVTSVERDGHRLVGVVLGGQTANERDEHMMALMDKTFATIAERGDQPRAYAKVDAPVPTEKPQPQDVADAGQQQIYEHNKMMPQQRTAALVKPQASQSHTAGDLARREADGLLAASAKVTKAASVAVADASAAHEDDDDAPAYEKPSGKSWFNFSFDASPKNAKPTANTLEYQLASLTDVSSPAPATALTGKWGIQVGAFASRDAALQATANAMKLASSQLQHSQVAVSGEASIHRARIANLSEYQARAACRALSAKGGQCFVYRNSGSI